MFRRDLYRTIARVLDALDPTELVKARCFFAGGTRIALAHRGAAR